MSSLNTQQMEGVQHLRGPMMVLAGPGSGKTTMITHRVIHMLEVGQISENEILVVTYTKAAAQEMCSRFLHLRGTDMTEVTFGTFHSVFWKMLREQGRFLDRKVMEEGQDLQIGMEILKKEWDMPSSEAKEVAEEYINTYSRERNGLKGNGEERYPKWVDLYEEEKKLRKWIDFDDMQRGALQMLQEPWIRNEYQNRFRYILVDEFQDVNPVQYQVLRLLAGQRQNIFVVGDDDQAIYGFRGAAPGIMQQFPKDFVACKMISLKNNYRSTQHIISFSGRIIQQNQVRYKKEIIAANGEMGRKVMCREFENEKDECRAIAEYALKLPKLEDMAVLFRTIHEADTLRRFLSDYNIPYYMKENCESIYEHWIGEDIADFIKAARGERKSLEKILKKPDRGIPMGIFSWLKPNELPDKLLDFSMSPDTRIALEELLFELQKLIKESPEKGMHRIARRLRYLDYLQGVAQRCGVPEKKLLLRFDFWQRDAEEVKNWEQWEERRNKMIQQGKQDRAGVQLMTLHASKGLEFPVVWIPELEEGSLPHQRSNHIEEERRLFYVGCTRAERQLTISYCRKRGGGKRKKSRLLV